MRLPSRACHSVASDKRIDCSRCAERTPSVGLLATALAHHGSAWYDFGSGVRSRATASEALVLNLAVIKAPTARPALGRLAVTGPGDAPPCRFEGRLRQLIDSAGKLCQALISGTVPITA